MTQLEQERNEVGNYLASAGYVLSWINETSRGS